MAWGGMGFKLAWSHGNIMQAVYIIIIFLLATLKVIRNILKLFLPILFNSIPSVIISMYDQYFKIIMRYGTFFFHIKFLEFTVHFTLTACISIRTSHVSCALWLCVGRGYCSLYW